MSKTKLINIKSGEPYDVYIGRGSIWGNPYTHIKDRETKALYIVGTRKEAISKYKEYLLNNPRVNEIARTHKFLAEVALFERLI